jgi:hypothetical protein
MIEDVAPASARELVGWWSGIGSNVSMTRDERDWVVAPLFDCFAMRLMPRHALKHTDPESDRYICAMSVTRSLLPANLH